MDENKLRNVAAWVIRKARSGHLMHTGASSSEVFIREAEAFICGMNKTLPPHWKDYAERVELEFDPEYKEYERLRAKFKGM